MIYLITGLVIFLGVHSVRVVAPGWREQIKGNIGEAAWKGVYSIVSISSFVLLIWGYAQARPEAEQVYQPIVSLYATASVLMALAFIFTIASNLGPGRIKQKLKHPFLVAVILWSIAHLLMNGDMATVVMAGSFFLWSSITLFVALKRPVAEKPAPALLNDILAVVLGLVFYGLFIWKLHEYLFGVRPMV